MRYARVLGIFWRSALLAESEYRLNFLIAALSSIGGAAGTLFTLWLLFAGRSNLSGWAWPEALVVLGIFLILDGLIASVLQPNLSQIVGLVQHGTLDFVLLKPMDSQFWVSLRNISLWGIPNLLIGIGLLIYGRAHVAGSVGSLWLAPVALALAAGTVYSLWFFIASTTIWFTKVWNATEVLRQLMEAGKYPLAVYPRGWQIALTFVLPVAFFTTVPAEMILGKRPWEWLWLAGGLMLVLLLACRWFWRYALRYYTGASA